MRFEATVGEDGCITIRDPAAAARLGLRPGEHVTVDVPEKAEARYPDAAHSAEDRPWASLSPEERRRRVDSVGGLLHRPDRKPLTVEEMNEAVMDAVVEEYLRGVDDRGN